MPTREQVEQALQRFTGEVSRRQGDRYAGAVMFGSRARDAARDDSDVDVAVILRGAPGDFLRTKLALADVAYDIVVDTGVYIQPLPLWEDEWRNPECHANPRLVENIRRDGVAL